MVTALDKQHTNAVLDLARAKKATRNQTQRPLAFPVEVDVQRIDDIGGKTFVKQKSENVVAVMSGSLKPYFYCFLPDGRKIFQNTTKI